MSSALFGQVYSVVALPVNCEVAMGTAASDTAGSGAAGTRFECGAVSCVLGFGTTGGGVSLMCVWLLEPATRTAGGGGWSACDRRDSSPGGYAL